MYNPHSARGLKVKRLWSAYNSRCAEYKTLKTNGSVELLALHTWFSDCKVQSFKKIDGTTSYRRWHNGCFVSEETWRAKVDEKKAAEEVLRARMVGLYIEIQNITDKLVAMGERVPLALSL